MKRCMVRPQLARNPRNFSALYGPEHGVNRFDCVHEFLCVGCRHLDLASTAKFCSMPEGGVEFGVCFKVLWLEEISP